MAIFDPKFLNTPKEVYIVQNKPKVGVNISCNFGDMNVSPAAFHRYRVSNKVQCYIWTPFISDPIMQCGAPAANPFLDHVKR